MNARANSESTSDSADLRRKLRSYTVENLGKIEGCELAGSHLLGVAAKAINLFETLLKETLRSHLVRSGSSYDEAFKSKLGKPFQRLTLGEVVNCLRMLDARLAQNSESSAIDSPGPRERRRTVSKPLSRRLDAICRLRAEVVAHFKSEETAPTEAGRLLKLINRGSGRLHLRFVGGVEPRRIVRSYSVIATRRWRFA